MFIISYLLLKLLSSLYSSFVSNEENNIYHGCEKDNVYLKHQLTKQVQALPVYGRADTTY